MIKLPITITQRMKAKRGWRRAHQKTTAIPCNQIRYIAATWIFIAISTGSCGKYCGPNQPSNNANTYKYSAARGISHSATGGNFGKSICRRRKIARAIMMSRYDNNNPADTTMNGAT